jgi:hypothetical protein
MRAAYAIKSSTIVDSDLKISRFFQKKESTAPKNTVCGLLGQVNNRFFDDFLEFST